jgi:hypothetical protein
MKRILLVAVVATLSTSQAMAWGLGDIGGKLLQKGVEGAVNSSVNGGNSKEVQYDTTQNVQQEAVNQAQQGADTLNAQGQVDPNSVQGVATNIASDAASQATTNALQNTGIPGAGAVGNVAGGLVKGFGSMFKKKPAETPSN